jgi:hypothetical protein
MQKAFSLPFMSFDSDPDDSQLVWLLGDQDCGPVKAAEESGLLIARPWFIPMKYLTPWIIIVMIILTGVLCFMEHGKLDTFSVAFLLFGWLVCLPGLLIFLAVFNRLAAKKGDYFKANMVRRTLELCRVGRTINASEIIAVTLLTRWYRYHFVDGRGPWEKIFQTGVLVRMPNGRVELYPVVREIGENVPSSKNSKWADRLADIFHVPVRRIELSRSESRELNDCN